MTLYNLTVQAFIWLLRILKSFLKAQALLTISVILISTLSKISNILAFLLPLKVILLFGSDRIPRYFKSFIEPNEKMEWAVGLALATVVFYLLSEALDSINGHLINKGAVATVKSANKMAVFHRQEELSEKYFDKVTNIFSTLLFVIINIVVLVWLNPFVFSILVFGLIIGFVIASILVEVGQIERNADNLHQTYVSPPWIEENWRTYTTTLFTLLFLLGFFSIIYPYFLDEGSNILISLISFIMIRQVTNRGKKLTRLIIILFRNRNRINALMLKQHRFEKNSKKEKKEKIVLNKLNERINTLSKLLTLTNEESTSLHTNWIDQDISNIRLFDGFFTRENNQHYFQWQLFTSENLMHFEREQFLFNYIDRQTLFSAIPIAINTNQGFAYQLLDCKKGNKISAIEWPLFYSMWMERISAIKPPKKLINAYIQTRLLLHHKLSTELFDKLEKTLCNKDDSLALEIIQANLQLIREKLISTPLYFFNPSFKQEYTFLASDDSSELILTSWHLWSLKPLGSHFTMEELEDSDLLNKFLDALKEKRKDISRSNIDINNLKLSAYCAHLIESINEQNFQKALKIIKGVNQLNL